MATKPTLNLRERQLLELYGVLTPPPVPPVEKLGEAVGKWGGTYSLHVTVDGLAQALVTIDEQTFSGVADTPQQALCMALCNALETVKRTASGQTTFVADVDGSGDAAARQSLEIPATILADDGTGTGEVDATWEPVPPAQQPGDDDPDHTTDPGLASVDTEGPDEHLDGPPIGGPDRDLSGVTQDEIARALSAAGIELKVRDGAFVDGASGQVYAGEDADWIVAEFVKLQDAPKRRRARKAA